jgi:hypothetical protein
MKTIAKNYSLRLKAFKLILNQFNSFLGFPALIFVLPLAFAGTKHSFGLVGSKIGLTLLTLALKFLDYQGLIARM